MKRQLMALSAAVFLLPLAGCQKAASPQSVASTPTVQNTAGPAASMIEHGTSEIRTFKGQGKIVSVTSDQGSVQIDHEEIKGSRGAGRTVFRVRDAADLGSLKAGDGVNFILEDNAGAERILSIRRSE
jgi:Cu/Ag efflux protein CusF